jgi:hypothetical protein
MMETFTPVLPSGRVGNPFASAADALAAIPTAAVAAMPAFMNSRRELSASATAVPPAFVKGARW